MTVSTYKILYVWYKMTSFIEIPNEGIQRELNQPKISNKTHPGVATVDSHLQI